MDEQINPGKLTPEKINTLLHQVSVLSKTEEKIDVLSRQFLDVPYRENTLDGNQNQPEICTVNLEAADCFTFLDYVEAMRLSTSFNDFKSSLKKIRYKNGLVSFKHRNHFFINWREYNSEFVEDITARVGASEQVDKDLNNRGDGTLYVPGVACITLTIHYVPSKSIDDSVIDKLNTGDYIGIYSDQPGLDVSHVGIFIRDHDRTLLRHASQKYQKVVDEDFKEYIKHKPGIIVLRVKK
jgi:hypothetical protein